MPFLVNNRSMIKNIIFDIGNVLATFKPKEFLHDLLNDEKMEKEIYSILFEDMTWWNLYNQGLYSNKDVKNKCYEVLPNLKKEIEFVLDNWVKYVLPISSSMEAIEMYKESYNLYIISDIPQDNYVYLKNNYDFIQKMKGGIYSYQEGIIKPNIEMFTRLLERYGLRANECLFIDDRLNNVEAASSLGIHTIHLTDYNLLQKKLEETLNEM